MHVRYAVDQSNGQTKNDRRRRISYDQQPMKYTTCIHPVAMLDVHDAIFDMHQHPS